MIACKRDDIFEQMIAWFHLAANVLPVARCLFSKQSRLNVYVWMCWCYLFTTTCIHSSNRKTDINWRWTKENHFYTNDDLWLQCLLNRVACLNRTIFISFRNFMWKRAFCLFKQNGKRLKRSNFSYRFFFQKKKKNLKKNSIKLLKMIVLMFTNMPRYIGAAEVDWMRDSTEGRREHLYNFFFSISAPNTSIYLFYLTDL